jgi:hypothetical protein
MIEALQLELQPLHRGRPTKFTPERIQQVRNLVERGKSRDEIAEIIGVTTGSLQVTCSKLGISLRRPTLYTGFGLLPRQRPRDYKSALPTQSGPQPESTEREYATAPRPVLEAIETGKAEAPSPGTCRRKSDDRPPAAFAIRMEYKGQERLTDLPLDEEIIGELAMEAEIRGMRIGELVGALILEIVKKDLFQLVRDDSDPHLQSPERSVTLPP